uniref:Uncharacterized protein n=1 Tax=Compsopogon caeruleus TaxID=31354 RepID=A0A7S1T8U0_9RHOD|mmetsp:Transcript_12799/g.25967  ORF Transcript_12799/g.25967 Transcript_12799/m.25967 type:complete len:414 (+) Transcript_12799:137-1378(+)
MSRVSRDRRVVNVGEMMVEMAPRSVSSVGKMQSGPLDDGRPFLQQKRLISFGWDRPELFRLTNRKVPVRDKDIPFFAPRVGESDRPDWMPDFPIQPSSTKPGQVLEAGTATVVGTARGAFLGAHSPCASDGSKGKPWETLRANSTLEGDELFEARSRFSTMFTRSRFHPGASGHVKPLRIPNLNYSNYGKNLWSLDLFYFLHNGIRCELRDLYRILYSMYKRGSKLRAKDIRNFFLWWSQFLEFATLSLDIERKVVFRWLETFTLLEGALKAQPRNELLDNTIAILRSVDQLKLSASVRKPDTIATMFAVVDDACHELLQYCNNVEDEIQTYGLEEFMIDPGKDYAEMRMRDAMIKAPNPQLTFPMALRWMESSKQYEEWTSKFINGPSKFFLTLWSRSFERTHLKLVVDLTR